MIKINKSILSIPPYISTQWNQISTLSYDEKNASLIVTLINGTSVNIPNLDKKIIDQIFTLHAELLQSNQDQENQVNNGQANINIPFDLSNMQLPGLDSFTNIIQHDPDNMDAPDLPNQVLEKVKLMSETLNLENTGLSMPEPISGCNCFHCQVTRALTGAKESSENAVDEPICEKDLTFKEWDIENAGPDLFNVINPLDKKEQYQVYLGKENMGCTCGQKNCPHLVAVLKSDA